MRPNELRTMLICFAVAATSPVFVYQDTQKLEEYNRNPEAYVEAHTQECLKNTAQSKVHGGALKNLDLDKDFNLMSVLTPEDIELCKSVNLRAAENLQGDRLFIGGFGVLAGLAGIGIAWEARRNARKGPGPKPV